MSYILDALNKSERERNRDRTPALSTPVRLERSRRAGRAAWLGAGSAVVAALALAVWWGLPAGSMTGAGQRAGVPGGIQPAPQPESGRSAAASAGGSAAAAPESGEAPQDRTRRALQTGDGDPPTATARPGGLTLNVLSYSQDPARRFAMIDQRIVRESDSLGGGVRVKRITPLAVVLEIDGREVTLRPR